MRRVLRRPPVPSDLVHAGEQGVQCGAHVDVWRRCMAWLLAARRPVSGGMGAMLHFRGHVVADAPLTCPSTLHPPSASLPCLSAAEAVRRGAQEGHHGRGPGVALHHHRLPARLHRQGQGGGCWGSVVLWVLRLCGCLVLQLGTVGAGQDRGMPFCSHHALLLCVACCWAHQTLALTSRAPLILSPS